MLIRHQLRLSYERLLRHGRSIRGTVVGIDPDRRQVRLDTGELIPFDAAIIATGSEAAQPAQFTGATIGSAAASLQEHQRRIGDAGSVVGKTLNLPPHPRTTPDSAPARSR